MDKLCICTKDWNEGICRLKTNGVIVFIKIQTRRQLFTFIQIQYLYLYSGRDISSGFFYQSKSVLRLSRIALFKELAERGSRKSEVDLIEVRLEAKTFYSRP